MEKLFIKNRKGQKLAVVVEKPEGSPRGLAFVMHGLGGFKEQMHIRAMAEAFFENGYITVTFDAANTIGESEGDYKDATVTKYYEDLEDVIIWSMKQAWFISPFILTGHSIGGLSTGIYTQCYASQVKAWAPVSAVVSGNLTIEADKKNHPEEFKKWEKTGIKETPSRSKPGVIKQLNWHQYKEDQLKFDLLKSVEKLKMPVLIVVGQLDQGTPVEHPGKRCM